MTSSFLLMVFEKRLGKFLSELVQTQYFCLGIAGGQLGRLTGLARFSLALFQGENWCSRLVPASLSSQWCWDSSHGPLRCRRRSASEDMPCL